MSERRDEEDVRGRMADESRNGEVRMDGAGTEGREATVGHEGEVRFLDVVPLDK